MTSPNDLNESIDDLKTKVDELTAQLDKKTVELELIQKKLRRYAYIKNKILRILPSLYFGISVTSAANDIEKSYSAAADKPFLQRVPAQKWLNLLAAYLNRQFVMTVIFGLAATVPGALTYWLMNKQNEKIDKQIYLSQQSVASQFTSQISDLLTDISTGSKTVCLDTDKLKKGAKTLDDLMYASCWSELKRSSAARRYEWLAKMEDLKGRTNYRDSFLDAAREANAWSEGTLPINQMTFRSYGATVDPADDVAARAQALTNALSAYRLIVEPGPGELEESTPTLTERAYSPERGLILKQFLEYHVAHTGNYRQSLLDGLDVSYVKASFLNLRDALIKCSAFHKSDLSGTDLGRAYINNSLFTQSNLMLSDWRMARLDDVKFDRTVMPSADLFQVQSLNDVTFREVFVESKSWPQEVAKNVHDFDPDSVAVTWDEKRKAFVLSTKDMQTSQLASEKKCSNFNSSASRDS
jgi:hypothetical protein